MNGQPDELQRFIGKTVNYRDEEIPTDDHNSRGTAQRAGHQATHLVSISGS